MNVLDEVMQNKDIHTDEPADDWLPIQLAPEGVNLEVGALQKTGIVAFPLPARRVTGVWFNVWAGEPVLIYPTSWRIWRRNSGQSGEESSPRREHN